MSYNVNDIGRPWVGFLEMVALVAIVVVLITITILAGWKDWSPTPVPTVTDSPTPTSTATVTQTATPIPPTPTLVPTRARVHVHPTIEAQAPHKEPISAGAGTSPVTGGNFSALPLPPNTTVVYGGCASDGQCYPYNFYWAPTHEAVLTDPSEQNSNQEVHELCHAHQHWAINGGASLPPSDYDLGTWYSTAEGQSFTAAVAGLPFPWTLSANNGIEDFAWTCTNWYRNPERLLDIGGEARYEWAKSNLP